MIYYEKGLIAFIYSSVFIIIRAGRKTKLQNAD